MGKLTTKIMQWGGIATALTGIGIAVHTGRLSGNEKDQEAHVAQQATRIANPESERYDNFLEMQKTNASITLDQVPSPPMDPSGMGTVQYKKLIDQELNLRDNANTHAMEAVAGAALALLGAAGVVGAAQARQGKEDAIKLLSTPNVKTGAKGGGHDGPA